MAYQNESYTGLSYTGAEFTVIGAYVPPGAGFYVGASYTNERYTGASYTSVADTSGTGFDQAGTAGFVIPVGFAGGFPFTNEGTPATVATIANYSGFSPDPGGILDNDSSDDGPLSYTVLTQPGAGTLFDYVGGAFTWDVSPATPPGRYNWTYGLYVNGTQQGIGTVTMVHGDVFASVSVEGFAGTLTITSGFQDGGLRGTVTPTGFAGDLLLTYTDGGTGAQVAVSGFGGTLLTGQSLRGTAAEVDVQGFAGFLVGDFIQAGSSASVAVQGFAGTLDVGTFFNTGGSAGEVTVTGFAGTFTTGTFDQQGTAGFVTPAGGFGTILFGFAPSGTAAQLTPAGNVGFLSGVVPSDAVSAIMTVNAESSAKMKVDTPATAKMKV